MGVGGEKTGLSAAREDLFDNAVCLVTPGPGPSDAAAVEAVEEFWAGGWSAAPPDDAGSA